MSTSERPLSDFVEVSQRFRRSVNLEKDYRGDRQSSDYMITPTGLEALYRLAQGLAKNSEARAFTITGPYGVGKSAFAVFVARLLSSTDDSGRTAREQLRRVAPDLAGKLADLGICQNGSQGFLPVLVTARNAPAPLCLAESITGVLTTSGDKKLKSVGRKLRGELANSTAGRPLDTRRVVDALATASRAARDAGYDGMLVIIDELGKFFEYAARYPQLGDVYVLQELAEYAARSQEIPTLLVGLLHQSFDAYGHHLDQGTRREWSKIQGRFGDLPFLEPADQVVRMAAQAICVKEPLPRRLKSELERIARAAAQAGVAPTGMTADEFTHVAVRAYPLHPVTLAALPYVFRKFAQNERSLFSYLE